MNSSKNIFRKELLLIGIAISFSFIFFKYYLTGIEKDNLIKHSISFPYNGLYSIYDLKLFDSKKLLVKKKKILVILNANCPICVYEIYNWVDFSKKIKSNFYLIVFIIQADRPMQFTNLFKEKIQNSFYLWDKNNQFYEINSFLKNDRLDDVYLLNDLNRIIKHGSPIYSKKNEKEYLNILNSR